MSRLTFEKLRSDIPHLKTAIAEVGVREISGNGNNPRILEYHGSTDLRAVTDEVNWCAAFVCWVLVQCGLTNPRTPLARHFLKYGQPVSSPLQGDIVILKRGKLSWQGHVGFFIRQTSTHVFVLGGNQADSVNTMRFSRADVLGYRRPIYQGRIENEDKIE